MMIDQLGLDKNENVWTKRFIAAAIIQGAIVVALTAFLVLSQISILKPEISRIIASGAAGTWFTFGYMMVYIVVGVIGVAVSSLFYYYLERVRKVQYNIAKALAWMHLILMNIGTSVAMGLMMIAGYLGGASMLPISIGGKGINSAQAHEILAPFVEPISMAILVILLGVIAGGLSFLLVYKSKQSDKSSSSSSSKKEHISHP